MQPNEWITVSGNHIPIMPGQTKEEAVKNFLKKAESTPKQQKPKTIPKDAERVYVGLDEMVTERKITSKSTDKQVAIELTKGFIPIYEAEGQYYCKHGTAKEGTLLTKEDLTFAKEAMQFNQSRKDQAKVLDDYKSQGYQMINTYLRTGEAGFSNTEDELKIKVDEMDKAVRGYEVKEPMTLYRGMNAQEYEFWSGVEVGKEEKLTHYLSTSPSEETADTFNDDGAKIAIKAPKGKNYGVPMKVGVMTRTERVFEPEFLLARGVTFKRLPDENGVKVFEVIL